MEDLSGKDKECCRLLGNAIRPGAGGNAGAAEAIDVTPSIDLRARALIALMVFSSARIGAALARKVKDVCVQNRRLWARLREIGGKAHATPCHHSLEEYLIVDLEPACIIEKRQGTAALGHRARRGSPARRCLRRTPAR